MGFKWVRNDQIVLDRAAFDRMFIEHTGEFALGKSYLYQYHTFRAIADNYVRLKRKYKEAEQEEMKEESAMRNMYHMLKNDVVPESKKEEARERLYEHIISGERWLI